MKKSGPSRNSIYRRLYGKSLKELGVELGYSTEWVSKLHREDLLKKYRINGNEMGRVDKRIGRIFHNIEGRCNNPRTHKFEYYGGRGIKCKLSMIDLINLWNRDKAFNLNKPSIDRIDNDKDYSIENCRFIERDANRREYRRVDLYKINACLLEKLSLFNIAKLEEKLSFSAGYIGQLQGRRSMGMVACKKEKAEKIVQFLNSIPTDYFKTSLEEGFALTTYAEQRKLKKQRHLLIRSSSSL